jgi:DNA primase
MDSTDKIKQRLSIVDVVGSYLDLKKSGKNYKAVCPFHAEDTPSFMVSPELGIYKCFGCGAAGDIFTFVQEMDGLEFYEALKKLAERAGVELEQRRPPDDSSGKRKIYKINEQACEFYSHILLNHKSGKKGLDYLTKKRGLSLDVIKAFNLGYAPKSWDLLLSFLKRQGFEDGDLARADMVKPRKGTGYYDKFRGRVMFPLVDTTKKVQGFMARTIFDEDPKYLNTSDTPVFNKSSFVYGLGMNRVGIKKQGAVFVEGPLDVISAYQNGVKNVVAPLGTSLTAGHLKIISRYTKDVTFCFDSDTAGLEAIRRAVLIAEKQDLNVKVIMLPSKYRDLDEIFRDAPEEASEALSSAVSVYDFFIAYALKKYDSGTATGKKKIVSELSELFSSVSSEVTLDHFVKKIANEIDVAESAIYSVFKSEVSVDQISRSFPGREDTAEDFISEDPTKNIDTYFLMLLLHVESVEELLPFVSAASPEFFTIEKVRKTYTLLREFVSAKGSGKLDIKAFADTIDEQFGSFVRDLYLWEFFSLKPEDIPLELEKTLERLEKRHAKSSIDRLTKELSLAEMQGDLVRIRTLTEEINKHSKKIK